MKLNFCLNFEDKENHNFSIHDFQSIENFTIELLDTSTLIIKTTIAQN